MHTAQPLQKRGRYCIERTRISVIKECIQLVNIQFEYEQSSDSYIMHYI